MILQFFMCTAYHKSELTRIILRLLAFLQYRFNGYLFKAVPVEPHISKHCDYVVVLELTGLQ